MTDNKRVPRQQKVKAVKYFNGKLACQRCANTWDVVDLNPERKVIECPICGQPNDIKESIDFAARVSGTFKQGYTAKGKIAV